MFTKILITISVLSALFLLTIPLFFMGQHVPIVGAVGISLVILPVGILLLKDLWEEPY